MKINKRLLPIKLHFFLFMGAMGPILPQLPLFGKDLGISPLVMGTITGILPFTFVLIKPLFGLLIDVHRNCRKLMFLLVIITTSVCFFGIYFVPSRELKTYDFETLKFSNSCDTNLGKIVCNSSCSTETTVLLITEDGEICSPNPATNCRFVCIDDSSENFGLYRSFTFWSFIIFMSVGTIGFNVINSVSDAICFDIIDEQADYGGQRLWGSVGFGASGLISGYIVDLFSENSSNYVPAFAIMAIFSMLDVLVCFKIKLPDIETPKNIYRDFRILLSNARVVTFITFTVLVGMLDGGVIYYLFWYLEDLAVETKTPQIKLIEGLILAAENLGLEALFFFISGKILQRLGHVNSFTLCFLNYALRSGLISIAPTPWWILPVEFFMQGPTFALTYTAIVSYANELAPPGMSATMQGIAVGMADGTGYAFGSIFGGLFFRYFGGRVTFQIFTCIALVCGVLHFVIHKSFLKERTSEQMEYEEIY